MSYTNLTAAWEYKTLISHTKLDQAAENDALFQSYFTAAADIDSDMRFNNAKAIAGEVAATGSYKDLIQLDASDICQLGQAGTEVRVPADPVDDLGVCTKQYAEALQMFSTQAVVSQALGPGATTVLDLAATTRGIIHAIYARADGNNAVINLTVTLDGVAVISAAQSLAIGTGTYKWITPALLWCGADGNVPYSNNVGSLDMRFNSTCNIVADYDTAAATLYVVYSKIP